MKVSLFIHCIMDQFLRGRWGCGRVLAKIGTTIDYPSGQTYCGQPFYKTGHKKEVRKLARRFLDVFRSSRGYCDPFRLLHAHGSE